MFNRFSTSSRNICWGRVTHLTALVMGIMLILAGPLDFTLILAAAGVELSPALSFGLVISLTFLLITLLEHLDVLEAIPHLSVAHDIRGNWGLDFLLLLLAIVGLCLAVLNGYLDERFLASSFCLFIATVHSLIGLRNPNGVSVEAMSSVIQAAEEISSGGEDLVHNPDDDSSKEKPTDLINTDIFEGRLPLMQPAERTVAEPDQFPHIGEHGKPSSASPEIYEVEGPYQRHESDTHSGSLEQEEGVNDDSFEDEDADLIEF